MRLPRESMDGGEKKYKDKDWAMTRWKRAKETKKELSEIQKKSGKYGPTSELFQPGREYGNYCEWLQ